MCIIDNFNTIVKEEINCNIIYAAFLSNLELNSLPQEKNWNLICITVN